MINTPLALAVAATAAPVVDYQHLQIALAPETNTVTVTSRLRVNGAGELDLRLTDRARIDQVLINSERTDFVRVPERDGSPNVTLIVALEGQRSEVEIRYDARLVEDIAAGERPGQIHNKSVNAHVGPEGIFLADGAAWHPLPLDAEERPALHMMAVDVEPLEGWAVVASGDPLAHQESLDDPVWNWRTPRPVEGLALVGGRHELLGRRHATPYGEVEVVMHVPADHAELAPMFIDAACSYLDLYTPLLGPFPYKRFSIVENFFSSGFAYPGFTLLGPRVVAMAPRSLAPGYLDHELVHNWWGNGVYIDPDDGNWCEGLTSFCANYFRQIVDGGEQAGRAYRRGTLMKLSTDPPRLDAGPLGAFGLDDGIDRFVGYDKGAFFFVMLSGLDSYDPARAADQVPWTSLRRFAEANLGRRAGWAEIQAAFEATMTPPLPPGGLDGMFELWVREHTVPVTVPASATDDVVAAFSAQYERGRCEVTVAYDGTPGMCEIDPEFMLYRVLPPEQIIPTVAGTTGLGGLVLEADRSQPAVQSLEQQVEVDPSGENLLLIGAGAIGAHRDLIAQTTDPIEVTEGAFTIGGVSYDGPDQAVLHTMQYPGRPGRFITVFYSNGDAGWSRLRLIRFYSRDTTIVWDGGEVIARRVFEPDRRIHTTGR
jgi:hypothetical protein